jgi:hypothetical protein
MSFQSTLEQGLKSLQDLAMTDPITYAELKHVLANDPQLAHQASELFQPHRVPLAGLTAQPESTPSVDMEALRLQRMLQKRSQMFDMLSNILKNYNQTAKGIIDSIGR